MRSRSLLGFGILIVAAVAAAAQQPSAANQLTATQRPDVPAGRSRPATVRGTVLGFAWTASNEPITNASVRLRDVLTGQIEATAVTTQVGEFVFETIGGGSTYVVELLGENGSLRAVGHAFTVAAGETVVTFVRLGVRDPWFTGVFGNTAAAVVSTAALVGVAAVARPSAQPISATR